MKKNVVLLTGIVFLIAILFVGACYQGPKTTEVEEGNGAKAVEEDSTKVDIFLKAVEIDGNLHLEMYDSKKDSCPVIDGLITEVYPGYEVTWKKAQKSNIKKVTAIILRTDAKDFSVEVVEEEGEGDELERVHKLIIPPDADPDTIKYDIHFIVENGKDTTTIDPYLRIKKQDQ